VARDMELGIQAMDGQEEYSSLSVGAVRTWPNGEAGIAFCTLPRSSEEDQPPFRWESRYFRKKLEIEFFWKASG